MGAKVSDQTAYRFRNDDGGEAAASVAANGSITVDDAVAGDITITLDESETDDLVPVSALRYDVQMLNSSGTVTTLTEGKCTIAGDVTRSIA